MSGRPSCASASIQMADPVEVRVRSALSGRELFEVFVDPAQTVREFKNSLSAADKPAPSAEEDAGGNSKSVQLLLGEKLLRDWNTLEESGVSNGSTVDIVYRRRVNMVATCSSDLSARIWDADTGECISVLLGHTGSVSTVDWSTDGARIITSSNDGTAKVWSVPDGECLLTLSGHRGSVLGAIFSPTGCCYGTSSSDRTVRIWKATGEEALVYRQKEIQVSAMASPDASKFVTCSKDKIAKIKDKITGNTQMSLIGHKGNVNYADWSPDGLQIVTASGDGTSKIWNAKTASELKTIKGHRGPVNFVHFAPGGQRLVTCSNDGTAKIWDVNTLECELTLEGHNHHVYTCRHSPDGTRVLTASRDGTAKIWCASTGACVMTLEDHKGMVNYAIWCP